MKKQFTTFIQGVMLFLTLGWNPVMAADEEEPVEQVSSYVSLGKPLVLNLSNESRRLQFLQVSADVLVKNDDAKSVVETHLAAVRHQLIVLLSEQKAIDMKTASTREEVRQQLTLQVQEKIKELADNEDIEEVLFSKFLVQ